MFEKFTGAGMVIAGIAPGEPYGSPAGGALCSALYAELTCKRGYSRACRSCSAAAAAV